MNDNIYSESSISLLSLNKLEVDINNSVNPKPFVKAKKNINTKGNQSD